MFETLLRTAGFRLYRCEECSWRGMHFSTRSLSQHQFFGGSENFQTLLITAVAILVATVILYLVVSEI